ncbi:hypothetical protein ACIQNG_19105 [Streptomyces sp. NPDC091377]|uniref:hypothetical protein n=1 Tax=unclassified Streptomyces TaxID=2593676 RepID=UPI00380C64FB
MNPAEFLPVPRTTELTAEQLTGQHCVWCDQPAVVDLGPRTSAIDGHMQGWRPRGCHTCTTREATRVHHIHRSVCPRCSARRYCPDGRALYVLAALSPMRRPGPDHQPQRS